MKAPRTIETERLILRKPERDDAQSIYRYASDPEVGRYLGWPSHTSLADTEAFLSFSDSQWSEWPAGPYLIVDRFAGEVVGSSGLAFESASDASTGYVIAKRHWGKGLATEATLAICELAPRLGVVRLYAMCHPDHRASRRVLEKAGFSLEEAPVVCEFPNLQREQLVPALRYSRHFAPVVG